MSGGTDRPRLVAVGTFVADTIRHRGAEPVASLGGLAYTVAVLSSVAGEELEIWPVSRVGEDLRERLRGWLRRLPGVRLGGLVEHPGPSPRVELRYDPAGKERRERLLDPVPPLRPEDVAAVPPADLVLVNCISGGDCSPATAHRLCGRNTRRYLDVHSLALGRTNDGTRFYRRPPDGRRWLGWADVVQCNRAEVAILSRLDLGVSTDGDLAEAAAGWVGRGGRPGVVAITLGSEGALLIRRQGEGVRIESIAAPRVDALDPTGAGDAFGAAYTAAWLLGRDPATAAAGATAVASATTTIAGSDGVVEMASDLRGRWATAGRCLPGER